MDVNPIGPSHRPIGRQPSGEKKGLTVLPDIYADGVWRGDVGTGGPHGGAGAPHVEEQEDRYSREAEDGEEGQGEDVGQEHELKEEEEDG